MNLTQLTTYPEDKIRALVGLTPQALGELLLRALPEIERRRQKQQANKPQRKRKIGGGRKRLLKPYQEILLTLMYLRHNVALKCYKRLAEKIGISPNLHRGDLLQAMRL